MAVSRDFRDLFAALNAAEARYLLVGGYAVAYHGRPRYMKLGLRSAAVGPMPG